MKLYSLDFVMLMQCFSGAHGHLGRIERDQLAAEAERYRYRVVIVRGTRTPVPPVGVSRKREREVTNDERASKRPREEDVILLSSDPDEPTVGVIEPTPMTTGRRLSPVSVYSSSEDSGQVEVDDEDDEFLDYFEDTLIDDELSNFTEKEPEASSSGTTSSPEKGKGKEVAIEPTEPVLDLQEELECFICCTIPTEITNVSDVDGRSLYLFSMWPWCLWTMQYTPFNSS
jgi:hypothetical protein